MSHMQRKGTISAHRGGLSVEELKQMTAKRMADEHPRGAPNSSFNSTFPPAPVRGLRTNNEGYNSRNYDRYSDGHNSRSYDRYSPTPNHRTYSQSPSNTHSLHNHRPSVNVSSTHMDKILSVQELKALTRMRLAREAGSSHGYVQHTNQVLKTPSSFPKRGPLNPSMPVTYCHGDTDTAPDKRSFDEHISPYDNRQYPTPLSGVYTRSGNTSPTVDSSSTGSDSEYFLQAYHSKHQSSPHSRVSSFGCYNSTSGSSYNLRNENMETIDTMTLPPRGMRGSDMDDYDFNEIHFPSERNGRGAERKNNKNDSYPFNQQLLRADYRIHNDDVPNDIHPDLHSQLLSFQQQQIDRDKRQRGCETAHYDRPLRPHNNPELFPNDHNKGFEKPTELSVEIPSDLNCSASNQTHSVISLPDHDGQMLPGTSLPLQHESSLRRHVLTKSVNHSAGSNAAAIDTSLTLNPLDHSLLPSCSPFYPNTSSTAPSILSLQNLPTIEPSPPSSPRSMRNPNRKPLSINCPATVRNRSSSDSTDLACAMAESVLLTPTAGSPASSFRKSIATSPNSRRNSIDSMRGSNISTSSNMSMGGILQSQNSNDSSSRSNNSVTMFGGNVTSVAGHGTGILDVDLVMPNAFSDDSCDELSNSELTISSDF